MSQKDKEQDTPKPDPDDVLRRMLNTPPESHKKGNKGKAKSSRNKS